MKWAKVIKTKYVYCATLISVVGALIYLNAAQERAQAQMAEDGTSALTIPCIAPCPSSSSGLDVGISDLKAFGDRKFFWKKKELVIRFLDGDEKLHKRVATFAREWTKYANIIFTFRRT